MIQVLLENSHVWNAADPAENSPILVVCYTNHALDQFLEGLSAFVRRGIVRVGGRSRCAKLAPFLLRELRRRGRDARTVPRGIFLNRVEARGDMELQQVVYGDQWRSSGVGRVGWAKSAGPRVQGPLSSRQKNYN